jgi:hypothetical protein
MEEETKTKTMTNPLFDIVIPLGPNDVKMITEQVKYTKKNVIGYRNIYIISYDDTLQFDGCTTISEKIFPFSMETVSNIHGKRNRNGWYLQQLLKLYAGLVIPNILDQYLVIDSDTFIIKPTTFYHEGKPLYSYSSEYHSPYFHHMNSMHPSLTKMILNMSGICHHMMFEKKRVMQLFDMVEKNYSQLFPFYELFLKNVKDIDHSGASEYEMYFNYLLMHHRDDILIRYLPYAGIADLSLMHKAVERNLSIVSCHWYIR